MPLLTDIREPDVDISNGKNKGKKKKWKKMEIERKEKRKCKEYNLKPCIILHECLNRISFDAYVCVLSRARSFPFLSHSLLKIVLMDPCFLENIHIGEKLQESRCIDRYA